MLDLAMWAEIWTNSRAQRTKAGWGLGSYRQKMKKVKRRRVLTERFHSRDQHLCKFMGTKESVYIRKEINSHRTGLGHQHGRRFIVLEHQYARRDVMWKRSKKRHELINTQPRSQGPFLPVTWERLGRATHNSARDWRSLLCRLK